MYLFLIMTPSQLLNAIVLSKTVLKDIDCDAYMTANLEKYKGAVENNNAFKNVYSYELLPDITGRQNAIKTKTIVIPTSTPIRTKTIITGSSFPSVRRERIFPVRQEPMSLDTAFILKQTNTPKRFLIISN